MARGLFAVIVQALFTLTYALFGALMVSFGILVKTIKKGPKAVFAWHDREKMPECMQNPELGTHGFLRLKVRLTSDNATLEKLNSLLKNVWPKTQLHFCIIVTSPKSCIIIGPLL